MICRGAAKFYDAIAAELGIRADDGFRYVHCLGHAGRRAGIGLTKPFDGNAASIGNGVMVALEAKGSSTRSNASTTSHWLTAAATKARPARAATVASTPVTLADPDGNKLNAFLMKG